MATGFQKHLQGMQKSAASHRKKLEREFRQSHKKWTDKQLVAYLANECRRVGHRPRTQDVIGYKYLLERLRLPWDALTDQAWQRVNADEAAECAAHGHQRGQPLEELSRREADEAAGREGSVACRQEVQRQEQLYSEKIHAAKELRLQKTAAVCAVLDDEKLRRVARDQAFAAEHSGDTDEELLAYLRKCAEDLGRSPFKAEVCGGTYIKDRFVYWNIALELAGLPMPPGVKPPTVQDLCDYLTGRLREKAEEKRSKQKKK